MLESAQTSEAAQAIAAAVAQIELAVREVQTPVEQLGQLIDQMSSGLGALRTDSHRSLVLEKLQKQVNGSITQLQFYDRLVQHLKHVQDYLSGAAGELASRSTSETQTVDVWNGLRGRLRTRLISESQRQLLDAMLPPPEGADLDSEQARSECASQGSVELF
jgi:uncharacterized phage infection (PIP) family protein YhgE